MKSNMSKVTRTLKPLLAPLSKQEERRSVECVLSHLRAELESAAKPRFRVLGVEVRIEKPETPKATPRRLIRVLVADYGNKRTLDVLVDRSGNIAQAENYRGFQPAFHTDEIQAAREIAQCDPRVASLTKRRDYFVTAFGPEKTRPGGSRKIGLRFTLARKGQGTSVLVSVTVDLCERKVIAFEVSEATA